MGSGKTSWAIRYMNEHPEQRFIFVTPYINEIARIQEACSIRGFKTPDNFPTKQADFMRLLDAGENIAITHKLFCDIKPSPAFMDKISRSKYALVLDEVITVVSVVRESPDDIEMLFNDGHIHFDPDTQLAKWHGDDYKGRFRELKNSIESGTIWHFSGNTLIWKLPIASIAAFDDVFILTFLFRGSHMEQYLYIYCRSYEMYYINSDGNLVPGKQDLTRTKQEIAALIDLYSGSLNQKDDDRQLKKVKRPTAGQYSKNWWQREKNKQAGKKARNAAYNYLYNIQHARAEEAMWSLFTDLFPSKKITLNGKYATAFCPCNARASNDYRARTILAYLINVYDNPIIEQWFRQNGGCVDTQNYALCQLLQWIWRSAIRDGKPIHLYLPSTRMRRLLTGWLRNLVA